MLLKLAFQLMLNGAVLREDSNPDAPCLWRFNPLRGFEFTHETSGGVEWHMTAGNWRLGYMGPLEAEHARVIKEPRP